MKGVKDLVKDTPMMQQYKKIKEQYKNAILFFRMGDFYEMFYEDAKIASKELEIALTSRDSKNNIPMAGVPHQSAEHYISKLVEKGYKVAICEQLENPEQAKGIVKRDVVRIVTPGTLIDTKALEEKKNNFLISIYKDGLCFGLSAVDISTGDFFTTEFKTDSEFNQLFDEISGFDPVECIVNKNILENDKLIQQLKERFGLMINSLEEWIFDFSYAYNKLIKHFNTLNLEGYGCENKKKAVISAGALLEYLEQTQKISLKNLSTLSTYNSNDYMVIDLATKRNLELTKKYSDDTKKGTLLWVLDKTVTAMGGRLLRKWIEQPLLSVEKINLRLKAVENLVNDTVLREEIKNSLKNIYDLERILSKIIYNTVNPRDLIALKNSLKHLPAIKAALNKSTSEILVDSKNNLDTLEDLNQLIEEAIIENPPVSVKDGGIIKPGYNSKVDELRSASTEGKNWIASLEAKERERTGIKSLKVGFNKVFGYYIEITKSNLESVPDEYIRKQTLVNSERFITPELKEYESMILGAEEKVKQLEYELFNEIREKISQQTQRIQNTAKIIAQIDVLTSLAEVAVYNEYKKPVVNESDVIKIKNSRHPVVEKVLKNDLFIPNDVFLNNKESQMAIITGPNMAGKSTYIRQVALNVIMAQIGSFIPAEEAVIGIVDRVFTRVGASDDLVSGQSTFMVEMNEVANILNNATSKSLIILDEVGRGTSTFDGMSIAWSVIEFINENICAKTLFATHYHELTELENKYFGIKNYKISVKEKGDNIIFLRKIVRGEADKSYGIQVARLAGLPPKVIERAKQILKEIEGIEIEARKETSSVKENLVDRDSQINLFYLESQKVIEEINNIDISTITPIEALNLLYSFQKRLKNVQE
ncbi:MAG: mismatch repair protein MutS [Thermosediminibacterales bacterium]|nr:mismatch repair protein MutS [Thermosediminibacterales bacterium]MDK2836175.1 mismatch repair protein MutS [Thermosediminibacterales bacterium]